MKVLKYLGIAFATVIFVLNTQNVAASDKIENNEALGSLLTVLKENERVSYMGR